MTDHCELCGERKTLAIYRGWWLCATCHYWESKATIPLPDRREGETCSGCSAARLEEGGQFSVTMRTDKAKVCKTCNGPLELVEPGNEDYNEVLICKEHGEQ